MTKKVWIGAGFALTAAMIAVGCSGNKTTYNSTQSNELGGANALPASAIATNNLGNDGGGFSNNNQAANVGQVKAVFNNPRVESLSAHTSADNSAMIFFVTTDNTSGADHAFVSHFSGGAFTPPVEITGINRDETVGPGATSVHVPAVVMVPFNTQNFIDTNGNANALVRNNGGNWAILWDAETLNTNSLPSITGTGGTLAGAHHTVYLNMFLKSFAGQPAATTSQIGNTSTTNVLNGTSAVELHHGFQVEGVEITSNVGGFVQGANQGSASANPTTQNFAAGFATGTATNATLYRPAEDIVSFGAATDTFVHCAYFATNPLVTAVHGHAGPVSGTDGGGLVIGPFSGTESLGPSNGVANTANPAVPTTAEYLVGDNTSFIQPLLGPAHRVRRHGWR